MSDSKKTWANIAAVERETGIGKDTLRVWERRYGFPRPERDENGDRLYPGEQISRLRLIKRLMDRGHRPGRLVGAEEPELQALAADTVVVMPGSPASPAVSADGVEPAAAGNESVAGRRAQRALVKAHGAFESVFASLRRHDVVGLRRALTQCLAAEGLQTFVLDVVIELNALVGEGWESGQIEVFEEHLYTEQMQVLLRQAIAGLAPGTRRPAILLTTVPEEQHVLGILMLEALLTLQGFRCISLGTQTPLSEIVAAVDAHRADVVALSFSAAFPARQVLPLIEQLRERMPQQVGLWVGGQGLYKGAEKRLDKRLKGGRDPGTEQPGGVVVERSLEAILALAERSSLALG